jgi:homoserine acetyltransferase
LEETAKKIKAKMLIINVKQDHTVSPIIPQTFASMVANAKYIELDDAGGHTTFKMPLAVMHEFLNN